MILTITVCTVASALLNIALLYKQPLCAVIAGFLFAAAAAEGLL